MLLGPPCSGLPRWGGLGVVNVRVSPWRASLLARGWRSCLLARCCLAPLLVQSFLPPLRLWGAWGCV